MNLDCRLEATIMDRDMERETLSETGYHWDNTH